MNAIKHIRRSAWILLSSSLLFSCTNNFEDINKQPFYPPIIDNGTIDSLNYEGIDLGDEISSEELKSLTNGIGEIGKQFRKFSYEGFYNDYQITTNLTHDIYAGYFANNKPNFDFDSPSYIYTDNWSSIRWVHFYAERSKEYSTIVRSSWFVDQSKYLNTFYISRIYFAFLASAMTDTYGDIPFTEFIKGLQAPEKLHYDSQKDVYNLIFLLLTEAADNLKPGASSYNLGNDDRCYAGDETKWLRFANTLRLRLALRLSNVDPEYAKKQGEAALAHPAGLMRSNADNMTTIPKYAPVELGGEGSNGDENIHALVAFLWLDVCMSKDIELANKNLSANLDPRCLVQWYRPSPIKILSKGDEIDNDYNGLEIGTQNPPHNSEIYSALRCNPTTAKQLDDKNWFGYSRETVWLGYAESKFLMAEAALKGWAGATNSPKVYFEEGIRASMDYYKIDPLQANAYINELKIYATNDPFTAGNKAAMMEAIITQKWLAIFPNGTEGWAEFRRTGYPKLLLNKTPRDPDIPKGEFIKRLRYPGSEFDYNSENIPLGVNQGTPVWWDVAGKTFR